MSKLSEFLDKSKIDARRLLIASKQIEQLRPEDRRVKLARRRVSGGKASDTEKELAAKPRRTGKAVTRPTLNAALAGDELSGKAKKRITAAVNQVLQQKKKDQVEVSDLF